MRVSRDIIVCAVGLLVVVYLWADSPPVDSNETKNSDVSTLEHPRQDSVPNMMFVKPHKVGGSTMSGIVRRITARHGGNPSEYTARIRPLGFFGKKSNAHLMEDMSVGMHMWANHGSCSALYSNTVPEVLEKAFKFTMTRDPVDRCLSQFYYDVHSGSRETMGALGLAWGTVYKPGDPGVTRAVLNYIDRCVDNSVYHYVKCSEGDTLEDVMAFYDLVGTTERWLDTITIIKMHLGLNFGDVIHLSSKQDNGQLGPDARPTAMGLSRPPVSEEPDEVLTAVSLRPETVEDLAFWDAANKQLDAWIERLRPEGFFEEREKLATLQEQVQVTCLAEAQTVVYDENGERKQYVGCYWQDCGCGIPCLDRFSEERGLNGRAGDNHKKISPFRP
ncbi:unnamed protein product [Discosporangium mesarthrocarpum]